MRQSFFSEQTGDQDRWRNHLGVTFAVLLFFVGLLEVLSILIGKPFNTLSILTSHLYLLLPLGIIYAFSTKYKVFIKNTAPLYCSFIILLIATSQALQAPYKADKQEERFCTALREIVEYRMSDPATAQPIKKIYSVEEYGVSGATILNIRKETEEAMQHEEAILMPFLKKAYGTPFIEILFDPVKICDKRRDLKQLKKALNHIEQRIESLDAEQYKRMLPYIRRSDIPVYEQSRALAKRTNELMKQKADVNLDFLEFCLNTYGFYELERDGGLIFDDLNDQIIYEDYLLFLFKLEQELHENIVSYGKLMQTSVN